MKYTIGNISASYVIRLIQDNLDIYNSGEKAI